MTKTWRKCLKDIYIKKESILHFKKDFPLEM